MKNEIIDKLYISTTYDNWSLIKTSNCYYSLRLGGFKKENAINLENYSPLEYNLTGRIIEEIFTDEEWVYLILDTDEVIVSGYTNINENGTLNLGIKIAEKNDYEEGFFQAEYMQSLVVGSDGWSVLK